MYACATPIGTMGLHHETAQSACSPTTRHNLQTMTHQTQRGAPVEVAECCLLQDVRKAVLAVLPACDTMVNELVAHTRDISDQVSTGLSQLLVAILNMNR